MIHKECITKEWITEVSKQNRNADTILVQKVVRALIILEGLSESKLEFIFKGGTALMLLLNSSKRLSIDIDIIMPTNQENLIDTLTGIALQKGFIRVEEQKRKVASNIAKAHYKFFFACSLNNDKEDYVLLDILFEKSHYTNLVRTAIASTFIKDDGEASSVTTPDFNNILGDKLTAFAPRTTGIPYFKKDKPMGMEIIKQLYDIGNIFERMDDIASIKKVFANFAKVELKYRNQTEDINLVIDDIINTSLAICTRGQAGDANFEVLQLGIKQVGAFIFCESYQIEKAITHASRTAYLAMLIKSDAVAIEFYNTGIDMKDWIIEQPFTSKLNKLKKSDPEAFFYWHRTCLMLKQ